jgi:HSP20 family protein
MFPVRRRTSPFDEITREFDRMMRRNFGFGDYYNEEERGLAMWSPRADVTESKEQIMVKLDLPGIEEKDIQVTLENNVLTISGERKYESDEKEENYQRMECFYGTFTRSFTLPRTVDAEKIKANYKNGVLSLNMPKREESKPKKIDIKLG